MLDHHVDNADEYAVVLVTSPLMHIHTLGRAIQDGVGPMLERWSCTSILKAVPPLMECLIL